MVEPVTNDVCDAVGGIAAVGELTYDQPTDKLNIAGKNVIARGIDIGIEEFTEAIGGNMRDFTVGTPIEGGAAFDLVPVDSTGTPVTPDTLLDLTAVCIVPSTGE